MQVSDRVAAVVVEHGGGPELYRCLESLSAEGIAEVAVVDNSEHSRLEPLELGGLGAAFVVRPGKNLGYGSGANRGIAASSSELVLVSNPDIEVHPGAVDALVAALDGKQVAGIAGPLILNPDGTRYPSARRFPSLVDAAGHGLLGLVAPGNRFTRRYRMDELSSMAGDVETADVDWVSGSFFLARRSVLDELGGFDESYFMYAEDVDLCWRARRRGYEVMYVPRAVVTHVQGASTSRRPYRMLVEHHRSLLRFYARSSRSWELVLLPVVAAGVVVRLALAALKLAFGRRG
jgi:N-acetylglucosaminyl-diphospho-decaprenol L-rhamnosyltransferase